jgi:PilZ domain
VPMAVSYSRRIALRTRTNEGVYAFWSCHGRDDLSRVRDLSVGGVFIETRHLKDLGAPVKVHFLVSEGQIRAETVVRHVEPGHGLGLKFIAFNDQDRRRFAALMNRLQNYSWSR